MDDDLEQILDLIRAVADALEADPQLLAKVREGSPRESGVTVSPS